MLSHKLGCIEGTKTQHWDGFFPGSRFFHIIEEVFRNKLSKWTKGEGTKDQLYPIVFSNFIVSYSEWNSMSGFGNTGIIGTLNKDEEFNHLPKEHLEQ